VPLIEEHQIDLPRNAVIKRQWMENMKTLFAPGDLLFEIVVSGTMKKWFECETENHPEVHIEVKRER
jgi:hypothetical protein